MAIRTLIVADDLTGALDTGVAFGKHGIVTSVVVAVGEYACYDCDVLVVNVNCRHDLPHEAYNKVEAALKTYLLKPVPVYIKTDSALRGNLSAMFRATLDIIRQPLMFIPAYPHVRRTTVNGMHLIDDVLLQHSSFSDDPLNPMTQSYIPDILRTDYYMPVQIFGLNDLKSITRESVEDGTVYVFDCSDDAFLSAIVKHLADQKLLCLMAGCAGFASVLSEWMDGKSLRVHIAANTARPHLTANCKTGHLIVSGSANFRTFEQLNYAIEHGMYVNVIPPAILLSNGEDDQLFIDDWTENILNRLQNGQTVIIASAKTSIDLANCRSEGLIRGLANEQIHQRIIDSMARLAMSTLCLTKLLLLTVFGGDTAQSLLHEIHNPVLSVIDEIEPGVAIAIIANEPKICGLITKSGGLGSLDVISRIETHFGRIQI